MCILKGLWRKEIYNNECHEYHFGAIQPSTYRLVACLVIVDPISGGLSLFEG